MIQYLKIKHQIEPQKIKQKTVYTLSENDFQDFSKGSEEIATPKDRDELTCFATGKNANEITELDRKKITTATEFILRKDHKIISKANIHGISKQYFQIGGEGLKYGLLFTDNTNTPAQKVYQNIGFKPIDQFVIAKYHSTNRPT